MAAVLTWFLLPKLWRHLPTDGGRIYAVGAQESKGKPVSAGLIFIPIFVIVCLLVLPHKWRIIGLLLCMLLSMLEGHLDDRTPGGWGEYRLGMADLGISLLAALILCRCQPMVMWFPLFKTPITVMPWVFVPLATLLLWFSINATNCTDGVDGLSGSLLTLAFTYLGGILYGILGHQEISAYLLVPHYPDGAIWGIMAFVMVGTLGGYLWYNANPSMVLMGDAGSRPMGLLLGMLVLASGNPFLILIVAGVVLVNGGTGLLKVALLRFFKIGIFKNVRYPLHDHVRKVAGWSNTQVLVRFMLIQAIGTPLLLVFLFKVR